MSQTARHLDPRQGEGAVPAAQTASAEGLLARAELFAPLAPEVRRQLAAAMQRLEVPAGRPVVREGEPADSYFLIAAGQAEVWQARHTPEPPTGDGEVWIPDPKRHTLVSRLGAGEGFGEVALLLGGTRRATVCATTDLILYSLDAQTFSQLVHSNVGLSMALDELLALQLVSGFLGRSSPFAHLPPETLRWLAAHLQPTTFQTGETLMQQGDAADAMYILRSGRVEVLAVSPDGSSEVLATLGPGEPVGEQALLTSDPRVASVRALEPIEALRLSRTDFDAVLRQHADQARYFVQLLHRRQRPRRIDQWTLEQRPDSAGAAVYILKDTQRQRFVKLSEEGAFLWELMDGHRTVRELVREYYLRFQIMGVEPVIQAMLHLSAAGFVHIQAVDASHHDASRTRAARLRALASWPARLVTVSFSLPDVDRVFNMLYQGVAPLYWWPMQVLLLGLTVAGAARFAALSVSGGLAPSVGLAGLAVAGAVSVFLQILLHEVAHGTTCKHFGREVHRAGFGWYFLFPVAFVDASDAWPLARLPRMAVALAGPYCNIVLSSLAALLLAFDLPPGVAGFLVGFAGVGYVVGLANLNPLVELDGYYALTDWLEMPNLREKALAWLGAVLWRRERPASQPRFTRLYAGYGALALAYVVFAAAWVLVVYQVRVHVLVGQLLPASITTLLGWVVASGLCWVILASAWRDLRRAS